LVIASDAAYSAKQSWWSSASQSAALTVVAVLAAVLALGGMGRNIANN